MRAMLIVLAACGGGVDETPTQICGDGVPDIGEQCDDGNRLSGDGCGELCIIEQRTIVTWTFFPMVGQPAAGCRPGVANIEAVVDRGGTKQFPCEAGSGEIFVPSTIVPGGARVLARALDASGGLIAASVPKLPTSSFRVPVQFYEDGGFVRVFVQRSQSPCTFPQSITLVPTGGGTTISKTLQCGSDPDAQFGVLLSDGIRAGTYDVSVTTMIGPYAQNGVTVGLNNAITDLDFTH